MDSSARYHPLSQTLHWVIAGLIVLQFILANLAEGAEESGSALRELALLANHKSVGITVLVLVVVRLAWRVKTPPPQLPTMPQWQITASHISHWLLYALILSLPVSGWLMSSASAYSVSWFNLLQLPDFVAPNPDLKETFESAHELLAEVLLIVAAVHVLAALKHHLVDKDDVLRRMSSTMGLALFVTVAIVGAWALGSAGNKASPPTSNSNPGSAPAAESAAVEITGSDNSPLSVWNIRSDDSFIRFTGDQAGAEFDGIWQDWSASIRFDADNLAASSFDVTINTARVETEDDDRDSTLMDPEWFDPDSFPQAYYRASKFALNDDGSFTAHGRLTIKGVAVDVALKFTVESRGADRLLIGNANLLRLELGVGTGEWEDTTWVSNEVTVDVRVAATVE